MSIVNIQASSRSKRSTNGELHPDHFDLSFSSSGLQIHLVLHRNDRLTTDVPTFTLKDGKMEYERPNVSQVIMIRKKWKHGGIRTTKRFSCCYNMPKKKTWNTNDHTAHRYL
jgi:hypothetical protein